jgi:hypothetical protein
MMEQPTTPVARLMTAALSGDRVCEENRYGAYPLIARINAVAENFP